MSYLHLREQQIKTTPQNVKEANEALFNCTMTLPAAAKHCGMSHKEMKLTFYEYLKYHPRTYDATADQIDLQCSASVSD